MIKVEEREQVRRAYFVEKKSLRQIARELKMARKTVRKAIEQAEPASYTLYTISGVPRGMAKSIAYRFSRLLWLESLPP